MKKLLFLSLFLSVPAWGIEEESNVSESELVSELFYEIDPEKLEEYQELENTNLPDGSAIIHQVEEAKNALTTYLNELKKKRNSTQLRTQFETKMEEITNNWYHLYIEISDCQKSYFCCWSLSHYTYNRLPFSYKTIESFLTQLPYVTTVARTIDA